MGMSASQARFLSLTARKTNVEYEGQQINQQRTTLSNESANYYSQLTSLAVPTPPSTADYSKISYTFGNGNIENVITSLIATAETKSTGIYKLNYVQKTPIATLVNNGRGSRIQKTVSGSTTTYGYGNITFKDAETRTDYDTILRSLSTDAALTRMKNTLIASGIAKADAEKMSAEQIANRLVLEAQYRTMAQSRYGEEDWMVRYQKNSSTGSYDPVFYKKSELENSDYDNDGMSLNGMLEYIYGEDTETKELKNVTARVEQDSSGRFISIVIYTNDEDTVGERYDLTTTTESDDKAYNDAMNQYYYDKAQYDQKIQEINAKIEIIQVQDKNLELKLKQLDTEENAISTEIDAVKKVISKNVENSFKTFNA